MTKNDPAVLLDTIAADFERRANKIVSLPGDNQDVLIFKNAAQKSLKYAAEYVREMRKEHYPQSHPDARMNETIADQKLTP